MDAAFSLDEKQEAPRRKENPVNDREVILLPSNDKWKEFVAGDQE
jgi:hypothetical protein